MSQVGKLIEAGAINKGSIPRHMPESIQYETMMGSVAYGVSNDLSDIDLYGWCIPPKNIIFPHLNGYIPGFGQQPEKFEQYQKHHINYSSNKGDRVYDVNIYSIVKYFSLVMDNNPNMLESLFAPVHAIMHSTSVSQMVRENRHMFLHKGSWHKFKGYAFSQMHKIKSKETPQGKRKELVDQFGYDVKFAYHVVRLIDEAEQILVEGDLDITKNKEKLKAIRRGEWKVEDIENYFNKREKELETAYANCKLPHKPDENKIKQLLFDCLEHHYGSISDCVIDVDASTKALEEIAAIIQRTVR